MQIEKPETASSNICPGQHSVIAGVSCTPNESLDQRGRCVENVKIPNNPTQNFL